MVDLVVESTHMNDMLTLYVHDCTSFGTFLFLLDPILTHLSNYSPELLLGAEFTDHMHCLSMLVPQNLLNQNVSQTLFAIQLEDLSLDHHWKERHSFTV